MKRNVKRMMASLLVTSVFMLFFTSQALATVAIPTNDKDVASNFVINDSRLPNQLVEDNAIFLGDKDVPMDLLKSYHEFYTNALLPDVTKFFPEVANYKERPIFVVSNEFIKNAGLVEGYYNGRYIVLKNYPDNLIAKVLIAHEFIHWVVHKIVTDGKSPSLPTFVDEGIAINISNMLYNESDVKHFDWTSGYPYIDKEWSVVAQSTEYAPPLWNHDEEDAWTITAFDFLVKKYGFSKMVRYLEQVKVGGRKAFIEVFGNTPTRFQKEYEEEVQKLREMHGNKAPVRLPNEEPPRKFGSSDVGIRINGKYVEVTPKAKIVNGVTFVPVRGVFETLGAKVVWMPPPSKAISATGEEIKVTALGTVIITKSGFPRIELDIGKNFAKVDADKVPLDVPSFISSEGSAYIPLRFISEAIGAEVNWEAGNWTVVIDQFEQ
ncbi:hypothetical protein SD70_19490 [Gordoniibacillus kamchatkensis]|uniref:Copper amine oxidase-like N-terminal domain-containing protein n=1 Tax=Gordoniibacillus kamchatkensis TaxID=1590651 RepID=A0ABR5AGU1_9BACL|nr:stalk domain-containing protein [Paenibacillus sp. VKM B-2647]KIL39582.1 hypothetical protein SD70_19490 [Paenibacillus sp. VKM B-2647]